MPNLVYLAKLVFRPHGGKLVNWLSTLSPFASLIGLLADWKLVVSILLGILLVLVSIALWKAAPPPKIRLYFDPAKTYQQSEARVPIQGLSEGQQVKLTRFCHVMVAATGARLNGCRGEVVLVEARRVGGTFDSEPRFTSPVKLKWANEDEFEIGIDRGVPRLLDLVYASEGDAVAFISTDQTPRGALTTLDPGIYRLKIKVDSSNAASAEKWFEVQVGESWQEVQVAEVSR